MPISFRQIAIAGLLPFTISACAQPSVPAAKEAHLMSESATAEHERGPAIPAAELRKRLLALFGSFQSLKDLEREHVEKVFGIGLQRNPRMTEGYGYEASTREGWVYGVSVDKLYRLDQPSTILIDLDYGVEPFTNQQPTYCTLEFEPLAKELVAMGYEQDPRAYNRGGDMAWGFGKDVPHHKAGFGIEAIIYEFRNEAGRAMTCIKGFRIGGGVNNG